VGGESVARIRTMTGWEREVLDEVVRVCGEFGGRKRGVLKEVAARLRTTPGAIANVLYRLRRRYEASIAFAEEYRSYMRRMPGRRRFLW